MVPRERRRFAWLRFCPDAGGERDAYPVRGGVCVPAGTAAAYPCSAPEGMPAQRAAPDPRWALSGACGGRILPKAPDSHCAVRAIANVSSRGEFEPSRKWSGGPFQARTGGAQGADAGSPGSRRAAPDPGWALWGACGQRFIFEAPDSGCAVRAIANAPSRGEGRARPGLDARAVGRGSKAVS